MKLSKGANKILKLLRRAGHIVFVEYEFSDLRGNKGIPLRYDFAIMRKDNQVAALIEYDGEAHFQQIKHFQKNSDDFKKAQERDRKKNKYALMHIIPLYRIPYWEIDNIIQVEQIFQTKFRVRSKYHNDFLKAP